LKRGTSNGRFFKRFEPKVSVEADVRIEE